MPMRNRCIAAPLRLRNAAACSLRASCQRSRAMCWKASDSSGSRRERPGSDPHQARHFWRSNSFNASTASPLSCCSRCSRWSSSAFATGSCASASFCTHSRMTCTSRRSPSALNRGLAAFFMRFQSGSGSSARKPSANDRQRRIATRRSCTGSGAKSAPTLSHSCSVLRIQCANPRDFLFELLFCAGMRSVFSILQRAPLAGGPAAKPRARSQKFPGSSGPSGASQARGECHRRQSGAHASRAKLKYGKMAQIQRRKSVTATVGGVKVGSDAPVVVQSMTNTDTADVPSTVRQTAALARAGSELVRVTVNNEAAAAAVPRIADELERQGVRVPIIGDFHYNGHLLLKKFPECAQALAKYRINPGNVSVGRKNDNNFRAMIEVAVKNRKPVRIGVNWGSLDQQLLTRLMDENSRSANPKDAREVTMEAMVVSALNSAALAEKYGLRPDQIILSAKVSGVQDLLDVYRSLAARCSYPLHLGLTEAGMGAKGIVASSAALGVLLQEGIGDTIRVSLTPAPAGDRTEEVRVAQQILQSLGIRSFTPQVTACPGCGRTTSTFFQEMAQQIHDYLREQMPLWKGRYTGVEEMKVAVMGCVVNGPGESKHASLGISLPGTFEEPKAPVYVDGRLFTTLKGEKIVAEFITILDEYVDSHYASKAEVQVTA